MGVRLRPVEEQVIVITGASSGIGLVTAKRAAERGARVVLSARNADALREAVERIRGDGGEAIHVVADVTREADVRRIADAAVQTWGGFDTWVNNAGTTIFGRLEKVPHEDSRQLFDVNYWGVVYGSLVAVEHLKRRGGALINMGSIVSERAVPLMGTYAASKHAVKAFTDSLRMELEAEGAPVSVTLIKPAGIDTPVVEHAKNFMDVKGRLPPPVYAPETVASAVLHCAEHPKRDLTIGGGFKVITYLGKFLPRPVDKLMEAFLIERQRTEQPEEEPGRHNLRRPSPHGGRQRGLFPYRTLERSLYAKASEHPIVTALTSAALGAAALAFWRAVRRDDDPPR